MPACCGHISCLLEEGYQSGCARWSTSAAASESDFQFQATSLRSVICAGGKSFLFAFRLVLRFAAFFLAFLLGLTLRYFALGLFLGFALRLTFWLFSWPYASTLRLAFFFALRLVFVLRFRLSVWLHLAFSLLLCLALGYFPFSLLLGFLFGLRLGLFLQLAFGLLLDLTLGSLLLCSATSSQRFLTRSYFTLLSDLAPRSLLA